MRKLFTLLSLSIAVIALVVAVLPLYNLAYIPIVLSFILGLIALKLTHQQHKKRIVQFSFLILIITLFLIVYKSIFAEIKVENTEVLKQKDNQSKQDALEVLELLYLDEPEDTTTHTPKKDSVPVPKKETNTPKERTKEIEGNNVNIEKKENPKTIEEDIDNGEFEFD